MLPKENAAITSKLLNRNHLPTAKPMLQARILTTQVQNTCLTSGHPTLTKLQLRANTGTRVTYHKLDSRANKHIHLQEGLYSAECATQLFSAAATVRVMLSYQHASPILKTASQSSGRWVTSTVLEPCHDSPQLPASVLSSLRGRTHTLTHTLVSGKLILKPQEPQDPVAFLAASCSQSDMLHLVCKCCESLQVFYCSRTHSQLSQFISELQRTSFSDTVATVALASRKVSNTYQLLLLCRMSTATLSGGQLQCILLAHTSQSTSWLQACCMCVH